MPYKKIIIILAVVLLLLSSVLAAYNYFFRTDGSGNGNGNGQPPEPAAKLKIISKEPVLGAVIADQDIKYMLAANGHIQQTSFNSLGSSPVSSNNIDNLKTVVFSADALKAVYQNEAAGQLKNNLFDLSSGQTVVLSDDILSLDFSPASDQIVYQYTNTETAANNISIASPDGSNWHGVINTKLQDLLVKWPSQNKISLQERSSGLAQSSLLTLDPSAKALSLVLADIYGLSVLFSPQGNRVLYSETDDSGKNLKLKVLNLDSQETKELNLKTLADKCVWSQDNRHIYCALPSIAADDYILPDDYFKGVYLTEDNIYKINSETNEKSLVEASQDGKYDASSLQLSDQESYLIFINKKDGLLYSLEL